MRLTTRLELAGARVYRRKGVKTVTFPGVLRARKYLKAVYRDFADVTAKVVGRTLFVTAGGAA